jgi:limonene-1,2-epoxide hydrolase
MTSDSSRIALDLLDCWRRLDLEDALSRISDDAVFRADCKSEPVVGRDAIRTVWTGYMRAIKKYEYEVRSLLASDRLVFIERNELLGLGAREILLPITAVFEINSAGKVCAWRDYWDTSMAR